MLFLVTPFGEAERQKLASAAGSHGLSSFPAGSVLGLNDALRIMLISATKTRPPNLVNNFLNIFLDGARGELRVNASDEAIQNIKAMQIVELTASAGRTFNHPHEDYSNLKPHVTMKAVLADGDDPIACMKQLQQQAEQLVEDQKASMLKALEDIYQMGEAKTRMIGLARQLKAAQDEIDGLRKQWPGLTQPQLLE